MESAQMNETYEEKLKKLLESLLTDDKIQKLNKGHLVEITKHETIEQIVDAIRNPSSYDDFFFGPSKMSSSPSFTVRCKPR